MTDRKAEAEIKVEIDSDNIESIISKLNRVFKFSHHEDQNDYFIKLDQSHIGGYDFIRIRNINAGSRILFTHKEWKQNQNGKYRYEKEYDIGVSEFDGFKNESILMIPKHRLVYKGLLDGYNACATIDEIKLNDSQCFFLEVEVMTTSDEYHKVRKLIFNWLESELDLKGFTEAKSILEIYFERSNQNFSPS